MSLRQCFELTRDAGFDGIELVLVEAPIEEGQGAAGGAEHLALLMTYLSFDSEFVGAYFDVGNILRTGYGEQWIRLLGHRLKKVHFCNFRGEVGNITGFTRHLLDGDVNWPAVMAALDDAGYDGWVTAEITPLAPHYPEKVIYDISTTMDWIIAGGQPA